MVTGLFAGKVEEKGEAPRRIVESEPEGSPYHAIVKKRVGRITGSDFLMFGRRFTAIVDMLYNGSHLELWRDKDIPLGWGLVLAGRGQFEGNPGGSVNIDQLTEDEFCVLFDRCMSMQLTIKPEEEHDKILRSFAQMKWTNERPRMLFFYAQSGGQERQRPLEEFLLRKLFYVPGGMAPSLNFSVKLGYDAVRIELEGKLF